MRFHRTVYEKAEKALARANHHNMLDAARTAVDAVAPVLWALWDVEALREENARLRAELYVQKSAIS